MKKKNVLALALAAGLVFGSQANADGPKPVDYPINGGTNSSEKVAPAKDQKNSTS